MIEILICFLGYIIGRIGDYYAGHWDFFHHWIYGAILFIFGSFIHPYFCYFGIGLIISDMKDFINLEIYGPDRKTTKNFWGFD